MPSVVTAQDFVNSPYVVTGETGSVHIYPTPALSEQIKAQQGPALGPDVLSYHGGQIMTGVNPPFSGCRRNYRMASLPA
jgi:hypothetical protein